MKYCKHNQNIVYIQKKNVNEIHDGWGPRTQHYKIPIFWCLDLLQVMQF